MQHLVDLVQYKWEVDTQDFQDEVELSILDDRPGRDVVRDDHINFMVRENPDNQRIILDDVKEVDQDSIIVLEDGNKLLIEDQDTVTATVISYDGNVNLLKVTDVTGGEFVKGETITGGTSGATAKIVTDSNRTQISTTIGGIVTTSGEYAGVKGQVSESTKKIQDSDYWQDYSYVIKVGESLKVWKDDFKRTMRPTNFNFFGEVTIATQVSARMKTGFTLSSAVEADEVIELFELIFSEKIGRRLGTDTDGTTLNSNPTLGIEGSASFDANTRDVTLTSEYTLKTEQNKTESVQGVNVRQGFIYAGHPRYKTINRFASTDLSKYIAT